MYEVTELWLADALIKSADTLIAQGHCLKQDRVLGSATNRKTSIVFLTSTQSTAISDRTKEFARLANCNQAADFISH
jgi:hypothetical protein